MTTADQRRRIELDLAISDPTLPDALRRDLSNVRTAYDLAHRLSVHANANLRERTDERDDYRRNEPHRVVDLLIRHETVTLDEILDDWPRRVADQDLALARSQTARLAAERVWQIASRQVYRDHADDLLRTVAAVIAAGDTPTPAMVKAWQQVTGLFGWHLPTMAQHHHFHLLSADRRSAAMTRVWEAVHSERYQVIEQRPHKTILRVSEYWPELATPEA